jgi:hypothetical protein
VITSRREEEDMPEEHTDAQQGRDLAGHELPDNVAGDEGLGPGDEGPSAQDLSPHERPDVPDPSRHD